MITIFIIAREGMAGLFWRASHIGHGKRTLGIYFLSLLAGTVSINDDDAFTTPLVQRIFGVLFFL